MKKEEKRFEIHLGESAMTITTTKTSDTRIRMLEKVIEILLHEYERKKSEELDGFMSMLNLRHENIKDQRTHSFIK
ncbi:hypothetical protein ACP8HI_13560 [Paenibacillus sp. FA6]|uniref:hypothetical protein n=1 Tax=Paenibacillus sp. FA6 TaxID=3413029 RepID=UPI003F65E3E8